MDADELSASGAPLDAGPLVNESPAGLVTEQLPAVRTRDVDFAPAGDDSGIATASWNNLFEDDTDDDWQIRTPPKRIHLKAPTAILLGLLLAAGAFWGGAAAQRAQGTGGGGGGFAAAAARLVRAGASGATGAGGFAGLFGRGGGAGGASVGTVTDVVGSTLYITNTAGNIVTVKLSPTTKITRTATATPSDLTLGDTVIVEGSTAKDGTVTATSISASAAGVTTAGGGGGGFGGGGGSRG